MRGEEFEHHLMSSEREGGFPSDAAIGRAGNKLCGDVVEIAIRIEGGEVSSVRYRSQGCGAAKAAASACTELVADATLLDAARVSVDAVAAELGGLSPAKMHAAELAADALHGAISEQLGQGLNGSLNGDGDRVAVAMSGGVDSAVAALLAKRSGAVPVALTLKLWFDPATDGTKSCCSPRAVVDARGLAHRMGMPHFTLDLQSAFRSCVVDDYLNEHSAGRTPNPCVRCNGTVRFDEMLRVAEQLGAKKLVTGHYARIDRDREGCLIASASDGDKDQSYMLAALNPDTLERIDFPLASMTKRQVREVAREASLPVAEKAESQDLCFLAGTDRSKFLARHGNIPDREGEIVDSGGRRLGRHRGHHNYTVGQRKGLGVSAPEPRYVLSTDAASNRVVVGSLSELESSRVEVEQVELYRDGADVNHVKLRYHQDPLQCSLEGRPGQGRHGKVVIHLESSIDGASPGQVACFMDGERVVGWGIISGSASGRATH